MEANFRAEYFPNISNLQDSFKTCEKKIKKKRQNKARDAQLANKGTDYEYNVPLKKFKSTPTQEKIEEKNLENVKSLTNKEFANDGKSVNNNKIKVVNPTDSTKEALKESNKVRKKKNSDVKINNFSIKNKENSVGKCDFDKKKKKKMGSVKKQEIKLDDVTANKFLKFKNLKHCIKKNKANEVEETNRTSFNEKEDISAEKTDKMLDDTVIRKYPRNYLCYVNIFIIRTENCDWHFYRYK